ncbi:hypothetical protein AB0I81_56725, partial [Nonomuraea sp. NPDC050404]|uniref:hypothetical protein n=1 Tax=Nonomuraea sp. NPDC050404 TaxID=3155783 RepID=UPI003406C397
MNFCLSDLVPPLRWSDASTITLLTGQPDLPDAWWRSLPMPSVLAAIGPEPLGELLTEIALEHWPAAAIGDVLPALHVLDPEEADEPAVAIALDRAGSWAGLLALTSRELVDQPFIQARPVLNTLFSAVLVRIAHPHGEEAAPGPREAAPAPVAVVSEPAEHAAVAHEPAEHAAVAHEPVVAHEPEHSYVADAAESAAAASEREERAEEAVSEPVAAQHAAEGVEDRDSDERHALPEHAAPEFAAEEHAAEQPVAEEQAAELADVADVEPASEVALTADQRHDPREAEAPHEPAPHEAASHAAASHAAEAPYAPETPHEDEAAERVVDADAQPVSDDAPRPEPEPEPVLDAAEEPAPDPAAQEAAALEAAVREDAVREDAVR